MGCCPCCNQSGCDLTDLLRLGETIKIEEGHIIQTLTVAASTIRGNEVAIATGAREAARHVRTRLSIISYTDMIMHKSI